MFKKYIIKKEYSLEHGWYYVAYRRILFSEEVLYSTIAINEGRCIERLRETISSEKYRKVVK